MSIRRPCAWANFELSVAAPSSCAHPQGVATIAQQLSYGSAQTRRRLGLQGCLSYTTVLVNACPLDVFPLTTCVIVIPSSEIVIVLGVSDVLPSTMK